MTGQPKQDTAFWSRAIEIVRRCSDLAGAERSRVIETEAGGDADLARAVLALLDEHDENSNGIWEVCDAQLGLGERSGAEAWPAIDGIRLTGLLGRGGSGDVYVGVQAEPEREVAVKVLRSGHSSRRAVQRFAREARALAAVNHASIARIYSVAEARLPGGLLSPCLVMELVSGRTLREIGGPMPLREAAGLVAELARGLHAAHQRGVVHRDLKPSNIIVDEAGTPRVIDFGIAALAATGADRTLQTVTGEVLGTLGYMSPEQLEGSAEIADVRTDVYALGVLFYELVEGEPAVDAASGSSLATLQTIVRGKLPRLAVGGDADVVYRKATELEPERRYESAAALADDLERMVEGRPVAARRPSALYTARLFARRHPWVTLSAIVGTAAVVALSTLASVGFVLASAERDAARVSERRAVEATRFLNEMLSSPDPDVDGPDVRVVDLLDRYAGRIGQIESDDRLLAMDLRRMVGQTYAALSRHDRAVEELAEAVGLGRDLLEPTGDELLALETSLGDSLVYDGQYDRAVELLGDVVRRSEGADGSATVSTRIAALTGYAEALRNSGRLDEAMATLGRARSLAERELPRGDQQLRAVISATGRSLLDENMATEARELFQSLVDTYGREGLPKDSGWYIARGNLAIALASEGRHAEAIPIYEAVLEEGVAVLGEMHHTLRMMRGILPDSYVQTGRSDEAIEMSERAMRDAAEVYGRGHPDELLAVSNHSVLLMQMERWDDALPFTRRLAEELPAVLGPTHPRTLIGLRNHAAALDILGEDEASAAVMRRVLAVQSEMLGPAHFDTLVTKNNLAFLLESIGQADEAVVLMREAVAHSGAESGLPEPVRAVFRLNLGRALLAAGLLDDAEAELSASRMLHPDDEAHTAKIDEAMERIERMRVR